MPVSSSETHGERGQESEIETLLKAYADTRDPRVREKLIVLHLGLVTSLANRFSHSYEQTEDFIQVGYIGLINAIDRFDPSRGVRFCTYAVPTIIGEMRRYLRDKSSIIRLPRYLQERRTVVERGVDQLTQRLGRAPTVAEIAAELSLAPEDVALLQEQRLQSPLSLDCLPGSADERENLSAADFVGNNDEEMLRVEDRFVLSRALDSLTPRERAILHLLFFADLSQAQIGQKLNISQMHVSRLARAALNRLRHELRETA